MLIPRNRNPIIGGVDFTIAIGHVELSLQLDVDKYPCQRSSNQSQLTFDRYIWPQLNVTCGSGE